MEHPSPGHARTPSLGSPRGYNSIPRDGDALDHAAGRPWGPWTELSNGDSDDYAPMDEGNPLSLPPTALEQNPDISFRSPSPSAAVNMESIAKTLPWKNPVVAGESPAARGFSALNPIQPQPVTSLPSPEIRSADLSAVRVPSDEEAASAVTDQLLAESDQPGDQLEGSPKHNAAEPDEQAGSPTNHTISQPQVEPKHPPMVVNKVKTPTRISKPRSVRTRPMTARLAQRQERLDAQAKVAGRASRAARGPSTMTTETVPRKRGRPAKASTAITASATSLKPRGRPPKASTAKKPASAAPKRIGRPPKISASSATAPKPRGRPPKTAPNPKIVAVSKATSNPAGKRRGRPPANSSQTSQTGTAVTSTGKPRGLPPKRKLNDDNPSQPGVANNMVANDDSPRPKKRGRPSKSAVPQLKPQLRRAKPQQAAVTPVVSPRKGGRPTTATSVSATNSHGGRRGHDRITKASQPAVAASPASRRPGCPSKQASSAQSELVSATPKAAGRSRKSEVVGKSASTKKIPGASAGARRSQRLTM